MVDYPNSVEEFVAHYLGQPPAAETLMLYRNAGEGRFEDVTRKTGSTRVVPGMGSNFGDLDNDGFLDIYLGTGTPSFGALMPNIMLKNDAGRRFLDVTGRPATGNLQKGHGVAFADLDNDGDEDVFSNAGGAVPGDRYATRCSRTRARQQLADLKLVGTATLESRASARIRSPARGGGHRLRYPRCRAAARSASNYFNSGGPAAATVLWV